MKYFLSIDGGFIEFVWYLVQAQQTVPSVYSVQGTQISVQPDFIDRLIKRYICI